MLKCVRTARALLLGLFVVGAVSGCSLPLLESQGEGGPTVTDIVEHINCELADIVKLKDTPREQIERMIPNTSTSYGRLVAEIQANPWKYKDLLRHLTEDHFVASVSMILDVINAQALNPSLSFITPINNSTMFNRSFGVGGSLTGTQERNITLNYSVDLDHVAKQCRPSERVAAGLTGDLGLADIVVDGLLGLEASNKVNIYTSTGPTAPPPKSYQLTRWHMTLDFSTSEKPKNWEKLKFNGKLGFSASAADAQSPGNLSLTGIATHGEGSKNTYFINLTGTTFQSRNVVDFSLMGNMTQSSPTDRRNLQQLGFSPKLTLAGRINSKSSAPVEMNSGSISSDTASAEVASLNPEPPKSGLSIPVMLSQSEQIPVPPPESEKDLKPQSVQGGLSPPSPGGKAVGPTPSPSNSTLFSSLIGFAISYGLNGGPNWTLATFKGPSGGGGGGGSGGGSGGGGNGSGSGGGGGGQLASINRTDTDSLSITFVAACRTKGDRTKPPTDYWESLPVCSQNPQSRADAETLGSRTNQNNLLLQRLSPGL